MSPELEPNRNESECPQDWRAALFSPKDILAKFMDWIKDQKMLFEAFWVAVSFHVLLFPLIWFMGWALPWPHAMDKTVVVEYDLSNWPNVATPKKVEERFHVPMSKGLLN